MVTQKTIDEIRKSFSRYFADETHAIVPRYVWLHPDSDSDVCMVTVNDPLSVDRTEVKAETKENKIQLSFDRQKEDENDGNDQITPTSDITTESSLNVNYVADGTIANLIRDFESFENCTDNDVAVDVEKSVVEDNTEGDCVDVSNEEIDDDGQGSTVSAQLSKFIKIYEHKECTSATTIEIESLIGEQNAQPSIEATENNPSEPLNAVPSDEVTRTVPVQENQQLSNAQNELCLLDLTDIYEVIQDPHNPTLFSIREKPTKNLSKILALPGDVITVPICFNGDIISPTSLPLKDCLRKRRKNPFEGKEFFVDNLKTVIDWKPQVKRLKKRPQETASKTSKKKQKLNRNRIKSANGKTKSVNVVEAPPNPIEYIVPDHISIFNSAPDKNPILIEQKTLTVNEWLQESAQVQADNNVDVIEFLQDTNLPVLSDIVSNEYARS